MIVDELVAVLGFKTKGADQVKKFLDLLNQVERRAKSLNGSFGARFGDGFGRAARDIDRMTASMRRYRREAEAASRAGQGGLGMSRAPRAGAMGGHNLARDAQGFRSGVGLGAGGAAYVAGSAIASATGKSIEMERSLVEVQKATDEALTKYKDQLLDLSRDTGKKAVDLAGILAQAGFSGRPVEELLRFTEYGSKASVAWRTNAEETGQALAEIGNTYAANQARIEEIGDAINTMADKSASRESDLLEFMRRSGASAKLSGLSAEQILPFAAAMKEVGVRTDTASTAFEALLSLMRLGEKFTKGSGEGLELLGVNSDKLRKSFVKSPVESTLELLKKIRDIKNPMKQSEVLVGIFGKEYQDDIAKLMNAIPKIEQYVALLKERKNYLGSVRDQFNEQQKTDVNKIDRGARSAEVLQIRAGDMGKSLLAQAASNFTDFVDRLETSSNILTRIQLMWDAYDKQVGKKDDLVVPKDINDRKEWLEGIASGVADYLLGRRGKASEDNAIAVAAGHEQGRKALGRADPGLTFGTLGNRLDWTKAAGMNGALPTFGSPLQRLNWMNQGAQQGASITNNTNTGNDQRTQSVTVNQTVNGVPGVAQAAATGAKNALSGMGPSIVKAGTAATVSDTAP